MTGVLQPRSLVLVRPDQEGLQISQVKAEPGDVVAVGQALAQLGAAGRTTRHRHGNRFSPGRRHHSAPLGHHRNNGVGACAAVV